MKMREINFRVWYKEKMFYLKLTAASYNKSGDTEYFGVEFGCHFHDDFNQLMFDKYILMQSIGLKDKNGVDIYEGDIVEYDGTFSLISWEEGSGGEHSYNGFLCPHKDAAIVGNIHQNPELLTTTKGKE